jgi:DNA-binding transcriptional LysR family regulator
MAALDHADIPYRVAYSSDTSIGQAAAVRADLAIAALPKTLAGGDLTLVPRKLGLPDIGKLTMYMDQDDGEHSTAFARHVSDQLQAER